ncbi:MAG: GAF domain-containing protein, partial [Acidobacteriota bacterium]
MESIGDFLATLRAVPPWGWGCGILGGVFLGWLMGRMAGSRGRPSRRPARDGSEVSVLRDLKTSVARLEAENTALSNFFLLLPDFTKEINSRMERRAIGPLLAKITERLFAPTQVLLFFLDDRVNTLILVQQRGLAEDVKIGFQVKMGEGRIGWVAEHKVPMDTNDFIREMRQSGASLEVPGHFRFKTELCAPMVHEGRILGVISVGGITRHYKYEKTMLNLIADLGSIA